jgi:hypothetical protein
VGHRDECLFQLGCVIVIDSPLELLGSRLGFLDKSYAFRNDFVSFEPPLGSSCVGGVGVDVPGRGTLKIAILLVYGRIIRRTIHALYTLDLSTRFAKRIGRLNVNWMQSQSGCKFIFPTDSYVGLIMVTIGMGVLRPSGNGHFLLSHKTPQ